VLGLGDAPVAKTFASGFALNLPSGEPAAVAAAPSSTTSSREEAGAQPETADLAKSEFLKSKDPEFILRNFRTMFVNAEDAVHFGAAQMKAALATNKDFAAMRITLVDDPRLADVVLEIGYTFAWDYPFALKHQNTSINLVMGKGSGPFSGPAGATSVAKELVKLLKPYRSASPPPDDRGAVHVGTFGSKPRRASSEDHSILGRESPKRRAVAPVP
jgi:hypothetical protein